MMWNGWRRGEEEGGEEVGGDKERILCRAHVRKKKG